MEKIIRITGSSQITINKKNDLSVEWDNLKKKALLKDPNSKINPFMVIFNRTHSNKQMIFQLIHNN